MLDFSGIRHRSIGTLLPCYLNFARRLFRPSEGREHAVISFNWDVLFERSLEDEHVPWTYSLSGGPIPVLKPHGSINWNSHRMTGIPLIIRTGDRFHETAKSQLTFRNYCLTPIQTKRTLEFRRMLFPGDPELPEQNENLAQLWSDVERALRNCEQVVFIGYSLPEYDSFAAADLSEINGRQGRLKSIILRLSRGIGSVLCLGIRSEYFHRSLKTRHTPNKLTSSNRQNSQGQLDRPQLTVKLQNPYSSSG